MIRRIHGFCRISRPEIPVMPKRFLLPTVSRRQFSLGLSVLVLLLAAAYLVYYPNCCGTRSGPAQEAVQAFRNACMKAARHANGGGDLVMDDATEAKIGAYCGCVSDAIESNVPAREIEKLGLGKASDTTQKLLNHIIDGCKPKLDD